jgi:D-aminopeptidase
VGCGEKEAKVTAKLFHPQETQSWIRKGAREAVSRLTGLKPKRLVPPCCIEIDFIAPTMATICSFIPGVERLGPRSIRYQHEDYRILYNLHLVFQILARAPFVKDPHF